MLTDGGPRRSGEGRRDLTEIAIDCFARYGYQGTSIDRIARKAGLTKGAIYYHFRSKEDLLVAAVTDRVGAFEERVQNACREAAPDQSLRRIAGVCTAHARSQDRSRFVIKMMAESLETNDPVLEAMRGMMRRFRAFLRNIVRAGQDGGLFRKDADAEAMAAAYTSAVIGAETQYYLDPERFSLEHTLETFVDQMLDALRPAEAAHEAHGERTDD